MSGRVARNSRMSGYILQSVLPYFLSTKFLTCFAALLPNVADRHKLNVLFGQHPVQVELTPGPMPMAPSTIRSLGATAPPRPSAEAGTIVGASAAKPVAAAVWRHARRVNRLVDVISSVDLAPLIASPPLRTDKPVGARGHSRLSIFPAQEPS